MIGTKDKISKKIKFLLFLLLPISQICLAQKQTDSKQSFFASKAFQASVKHSNKQEKLFSDRKLFMLLGEESFLYDTKFDLFAVYFSAPRDGKAIETFIVKSRNGIVTISHKSFDAKNFNIYDDKSFENKIEKSNTSMKFLNPSFISSYKNEFSKIIKRDI